jgi:choline dehydrogenase-like flavoprotein
MHVFALLNSYVSSLDVNIHNGRRVSASRAYLHPAMKRKNLEVQTRAFVTKLNFEGNKVTGLIIVVIAGS